MKRSTITTVLLVVVIGGLVASTGYALNLMNNYKSMFEEQISANNTLSSKNKKLTTENEQKKKELLEKQNAIVELEKEKGELNKITDNQKKNTSDVSSIDDTQQTEAIREDSSMIESKNADVTMQSIPETEQFATYEGYGNVVRFALAFETSVDQLLLLNNLNSADQIVVGQSYRVK